MSLKRWKSDEKLAERISRAIVSGSVSHAYIIEGDSCVDKEAFALAVFSAAASVGRRVRIMDRLCQPADHSVSIYHPEGEYLKGLVLYVE